MQDITHKQADKCSQGHFLKMLFYVNPGTNVQPVFQQYICSPGLFFTDVAGYVTHLTSSCYRSVCSSSSDVIALCGKKSFTLCFDISKSLLTSLISAHSLISPRGTADPQPCRTTHTPSVVIPHIFVSYCDLDVG